MNIQPSQPRRPTEHTELVKGVRRLHDEGMTITEIAQAICRSPSWVYAMIKESNVSNSPSVHGQQRDSENHRSRCRVSSGVSSSRDCAPKFPGTVMVAQEKCPFCVNGKYTGLFETTDCEHCNGTRFSGQASPEPTEDVQFPPTWDGVKLATPICFSNPQEFVLDSNHHHFLDQTYVVGLIANYQPTDFQILDITPAGEDAYCLNGRIRCKSGAERHMSFGMELGKDDIEKFAHECVFLGSSYYQDFMYHVRGLANALHDHWPNNQPARPKPNDFPHNWWTQAIMPMTYHRSPVSVVMNEIKNHHKDDMRKQTSGRFGNEKGCHLPVTYDDGMFAFRFAMDLSWKNLEIQYSFDWYTE